MSWLRNLNPGNQIPLRDLGEPSVLKTNKRNSGIWCSVTTARLLLVQFLSLNEFCNTNLDIVAHRTNLIHGTAFWIGQCAVIPAKAWHVGAFVAATHGDEQGRIVCKLLGQLLWFGGAEIDANLLHGCK